MSQTIRHHSDYREKRRKAYPKIEDQLDAFWKGGEEEEVMRRKVRAVKEKYRKEGRVRPSGDDD